MLLQLAEGNPSQPVPSNKHTVVSEGANTQVNIFLIPSSAQSHQIPHDFEVPRAAPKYLMKEQQ